VDDRGVAQGICITVPLQDEFLIIDAARAIGHQDQLEINRSSSRGWRHLRRGRSMPGDRKRNDENEVPSVK